MLCAPSDRQGHRLILLHSASCAAPRLVWPDQMPAFPTQFQQLSPSCPFTHKALLHLVIPFKTPSSHARSVWCITPYTKNHETQNWWNSTSYTISAAFIKLASYTRSSAAFSHAIQFKLTVCKEPKAQPGFAHHCGCETDFTPGRVPCNSRSCGLSASLQMLLASFRSRHISCLTASLPCNSGNECCQQKAMLLMTLGATVAAKQKAKLLLMSFALGAARQMALCQLCCGLLQVHLNIPHTAPHDVAHTCSRMMMKTPGHA